MYLENLLQKANFCLICFDVEVQEARYVWVMSKLKNKKKLAA